MALLSAVDRIGLGHQRVRAVGDLVTIVDAIVVGEGDELWPELLDDIEHGKLKSRYRSSRPPDITNLPVPREMFPVARMLVAGWHTLPMLVILVVPCIFLGWRPDAVVLWLERRFRCTCLCGAAGGRGTLPDGHYDP